MKKSYFAIGAIVAAMCSCSSESIPSAGEGNVLPGTEDLSPISLSMTGNNTSVEVGSRTRGTGNVGGDNGTTWQNEKLYVLMTSSDVDCLGEGDIDKHGSTDKDDWTGWGFTNLNGEGPWLREQFNGAIWARPELAGDKWNLIYNHNTLNLENNDWYKGAGVNRFYPINGASDFFAFHVDDACKYQFNQGEEGYVAAEDFDYTTKAVATGLDDPNYVLYKASATSSEYRYPQGNLDAHYPLITKDVENSRMSINFRINGTQDLLAGKAAHVEGYPKGFSAKSARNNKVPNISMEHLLSRLTFTIYRGDELAKNIQITGITIKDVRNQGRMIVAYKDNPTNGLIQWKRTGADAVSPDDDTYDEGALDLTQKYYRSDFTLMQSPTNIIGNGTDPVTLKTDKNKLVPLKAFAVGSIQGWLQPNKEGTEWFKPIGSPMFVAPGEDEYEMVLNYKVLVRDNDKDGAFDEPTTPTNPTDGDLIENMQVKYTLKAPANGVFAQGKSYNIKITVYGLQPITATVELTNWVEAGDVWIGGDAADDKPENL